MSDNIEPSLGSVKSTIKPEPKPHVREGGQKGFYQPGEHAKDSFIWMTLKYCFYLGAIFSVCLMLVFFHFSFDRNEPEKFDVVSALKDVWSIFTPILTLALGYAFGKREA